MLITSTQCCKILAIEGRPINERTFLKILKQANIKAVMVTPQGTRLYDESDILAIKKSMPKRRGNPGHAIVLS